MQREVLFAGFGGQGVLFVGRLLAQAALRQGREVAWVPSYGPEVRGGTANSTVVFGDRPLGSLVVSRPSIVVVLNEAAFDKYEPRVKPGGLLLVNSSLVTRVSQRGDIRTFSIPATRLAGEAGDETLASIVMLGALVALEERGMLEDVAQAIQELLPEKHRTKLSANIIALHKGAEAVSLLVKAAAGGTG